ncbi:MAG: hypothetical protein WBD33_22380 [Xanthobacteraceae bacterium]
MGQRNPNGKHQAGVIQADIPYIPSRKLNLSRQSAATFDFIKVRFRGLLIPKAPPHRRRPAQELAPDFSGVARGGDTQVVLVVLLVSVLATARKLR